MTRTGTEGRAATGIVLMCVGVACLCVNDAIAKTLTAGYAPPQILFLRNILAVPVAAALALRMGGRAALRTRQPLTHLLRGALWIASATLFFTGLSRLGLAEATALIFAAPVFTTALAALVLRDAVGWRRWMAVAAGFVGVLIIVEPGAATFQPASLYPITAAFLYAVLMLSARRIDPGESVWTLTFQLVCAGALTSGLASVATWVPLQAGDFWLYLGIALFGTLGMVLMTQAFRVAEATLVAPFDYTALLWASLLGWWLWGETPGLNTWIGAAIIIASGIFIVFREARLRA